MSSVTDHGSEVKNLSDGEVLSYLVEDNLRNVSLYAFFPANS